MKRFLERGSMEANKPLLFGVGLALAAPVAGYAVARAVSHVSRATEVRSASGHKRFLSDTINGSRGIKHDLGILQNEQASANIIWSTSRILSNCSRNGEKQESPEQTSEEQEIAYLKNLVQELQKREEILQTQMLTYDGLREQEAAVGDLEGRLRLSSAENERLHSELKSLEDENLRLNLQASEYLEAMKELESAKKSEEAKQFERKLAQDAAVGELEDRLRLNSAETDRLHSELKSLEDENLMLKLQGSEHLEAMEELKSIKSEEAKQFERKLASFSLCAKEEITLLEQKITMMLDEQKIEEDELNRFKDLEDEAAELRRINLQLAEENGDLKLRIQSASATSSSKLQTIQTEYLEEISILREENEELKNKMEQLKTDHFEDVKELIYLRWINACLRHKLSQHSHMISSEKTTAREVSENFDPQSEQQKADELVHDYANECTHNKKKTRGGLECHDLTKKDKFFGKVLKKMTIFSRKNSSKVAVDDRMDDGSPSSCISETSTKSLSSCCNLEKARRYSSDSNASCLTLDHLIGGTEMNADDRWQHGSPWIQANFRSPFSSSLEAGR